MSIDLSILLSEPNPGEERKRRVLRIYNERDSLIRAFDDKLDIDLVEHLDNEFQYYPWWCVNVYPKTLRRGRGKTLHYVEVSDLDEVEQWWKQFKAAATAALEESNTDLFLLWDVSKDYNKVLRKLKRLWRERPKAAIPPNEYVKECPWIRT